MLELEETLRITYVVHCPSFINKEKEILKGEFNQFNLLKVN